jgi:aarF domain-containing kinase
MRGAALKLGQMLSLQDESFLPAPLAEALKRVRTHADVMPAAQLERVMSDNLGAEWRSKFAHFGTLPVAAASIGQVHQAALHDGRAVAVKVQYPGVAQSIHSDLSNLETLLSVLRVAPPGLYLDRIIEVAREELAEECDYTLEAGYQARFRSLLAGDPDFLVPELVQDLSSANVLTSGWVDGVPIDDDSVIALPQEERNRLALALLRLCLREVFEFQLVQTDPNWSNFLYDHSSKKLVLLDFGATRPLSEDFSANYLDLVWAAANADRDELLAKSVALGFLTGEESQAMVYVMIAFVRS